MATNPPKDTLESFDKKKYVIDHHQYPIDLGGDTKYGGHRIIFYINVQGGGKIALEDGRGADTHFMHTRLATAELGESRYKPKSGDALKAEVRRATNKFTGLTLDFTKPKKRLLTAISLYIPETLIKSYNVNWGEASGDEMMTSEAVAQAALGGAKMVSGAMLAGVEQAIKAGVGLKGAKILNQMQYAQKALGVTPGNAKAEQLFRSVEFNQFTFDYKFAPKSEAEAANVLNIIRTFRHHMLPEYLDKLNFLYIYPSEFEVRYYKDDRENIYLEHHMTAVLKSVNINYNPNGQFSTFANGMPTHINLTLQFQELAVPTKETSPADRSGA